MPNSDVIIYKRTIDHEHKVGVDGNLYVFVAESRSKNAVYELSEQRERRCANYKAKNKNEFHLSFLN